MFSLPREVPPSGKQEPLPLCCYSCPKLLGTVPPCTHHPSHYGADVYNFLVFSTVCEVCSVLVIVAVACVVSVSPWAVGVVSRGVCAELCVWGGRLGPWGAL